MISELSRSNVKEFLSYAFQQCRSKTLALFVGMDESTFRYQVHPDFSPVGWHLGHIAYTESLWLLERSAGFPCLFPQYRKLYAADGLPKSERVELPNLEETLNYLETIRVKVLDYLDVADLQEQERLWRFLLQHESQHNETIAIVLELIKIQNPLSSPSPLPQLYFFSPPTEMIQIPAGEFEMGSRSIDAMDNERTAHKVYVETFWIDQYPVTCQQYRSFIQAGGYDNPRWWSKAGWEWLQTEQVKQPLYWQEDPAWDNHPVCGVSWYEAQAYSQFVGKRLPTEAEWEKAARWDANERCCRVYPWGDEPPTPEYCNHDYTVGQTTPVNAYPKGQSAYGMYDALGNVWEWTASWFDAYPGFQSYPYPGYSQTYFDQQHRVLKGGSWVTRPWAMRSSFRNWYYPSVRQIFAGFRCATDQNIT